MVTVREILDWLDAWAPFRFAESWDQCGLQVGDPAAGVERLLVALDVSSQTMAEAEELECQCLVTHHPLIFRPLNAVRRDQFPGYLVAGALQKGIHLIAAHTNLDAARDGTNDQLAKVLSLEKVEPLLVELSWREESRYGGMGRVGFLPHPKPLESLAGEIRQALGNSEIRMVGRPGKQVRHLAVCSGSGGSLMEQVIALGADAYVTGDVKYHEAKRAVEADLAVIDVGHFASERLILDPLAACLRKQAELGRSPLEVFVSSEETDPFWVYRSW